LILAPEFERLRPRFPTDGSHISAAQGADFIGISRAAVYKVINAGTLQALRIGNVTVVNKKSTIEYRQRRESSSEQPADAVTHLGTGQSRSAFAKKSRKVKPVEMRARMAQG
jgi:predicted DNA-binding transcriptional regulator AlpA